MVAVAQTQKLALVFAALALMAKASAVPSSVSGLTERSGGVTVDSNNPGPNGVAVAESGSPGPINWGAHKNSSQGVHADSQDSGPTNGGGVSADHDDGHAKIADGTPKGVINKQNSGVDVDQNSGEKGVGAGEGGRVPVAAVDFQAQKESGMNPAMDDKSVHVGKEKTAHGEVEENDGKVNANDFGPAGMVAGHRRRTPCVRRAEAGRERRSESGVDVDKNDGEQGVRGGEKVKVPVAGQGAAVGKDSGSDGGPGGVHAQAGPGRAGAHEDDGHVKVDDGAAGVVYGH